jgi:putative Ca2+/H+ antiporter (TMEM165/GDT1 family)
VNGLAIFATALLVVLSVELPDKTLVASLVLATRYRPLPVLLGVSAAFLVQCAFAVTAGSLIMLLPRRLVLAVAALLFAIGAVIVLREVVRQRHRQEEEEVERAAAGVRNPGGMRVAALSFGVLFAAEWGDASQLATAALTAHYGAGVAVFLGSFVALVGLAAVAVFAGKAVLRYVPLVLVHRIAGGLFAFLALLTAYQAIRP